jgi:tetratricopeptide (TPR) repeat protein
VLPLATIAVATGRGVVADRLPVGEVIESAARLVARERGAAEPAVVLDRVTAGLLDVRFEVLARPDGAHVLAGERKLADATRKLLGTPTTTIGRERELGFLLGLFEESTTEPMARVAVVTGPAGIGKSRLRYEFLLRLAKREPGAEVWIARGDPIGAGSPFGLLSQVLRRAAGIFDGEPAALSRDKLRARVERNVAAHDVPRVAAFLGEIARVPFPIESRPELEAARRDPVLMGDQTRLAWTDFVAAECAAAPVVLVLEDLHWGDLPTVSFVDSALRGAEDLPLLVLVLARPELFDRFGDLFKHRDPQQLRLGALTRKAAEKLVREVLGAELSDDLVARIVERSEGNAFFLEELIRSVAEGERDALPETLVAMMQARLEALPDGARRVLRAASVFGGVFWDSAVAAMTGQDLDAGTVGEWLRLLVERELCVPRAQSRFPGTRELVFRHALVREAAYEMLTPSDRELGHRLGGTWLEENGEPDAMVLAEHFASAAVPEQAFRWFRVAADEALDANDFTLAIRAVERAIELGGSSVTPQVAGELERVRAEAHYWRGDHPEAQKSAERSLEWLEPGTNAWYLAAAVYCTASNRVGGVDGAVRLAERIHEEGWAAKPDVSAVIGCTRVTVVLIQSGHYELADRLLAQIEPNLAALGDDPAALSRWQASLAARALYTGKTGEYLQLSELAAESSRSAGDLRGAAIQSHNLGHANVELGRYEEAERHLRAVSIEAGRLGLANVSASAKNNLGWAAALQGRHLEARELLERSIVELEGQSDRRMLGGALNHLAQTLLEMGHPDAAEAPARRAVEALELFLPLLCQAKGTLSRILLAKGMVDDALALSSEAVALLDQLGSMADGEIGVRLANAEALQAGGRPEAAREALGLARGRLLARAEAIDDADVRQSFLTRVPDNVRTLELAAAWLPPQSG